MTTRLLVLALLCVAPAAWAWATPMRGGTQAVATPARIPAALGVRMQQHDGDDDDFGDAEVREHKAVTG